jgi:hypothetical protein
MIRKLIAIVLAVLINGAVLVWFHAWSSAAVASAAAAHAQAPTIVTLPVTTVYPSAAQMRQLKQKAAPAMPDEASLGGGPACLVMPYYSFATQCDATVHG